MAKRDLVLLAEFKKTGMAAGETWRPTPASGNAELDAGEFAEVAFLEIESPVDGTGNPEDLKYVWPVLDKVEIPQYVLLSGNRDTNMMPPRGKIWSSQYIYFGDGILDALDTATPALNNTTLKYRESFSIVAVAGAAITGTITIRAWGYRYNRKEQEKLLPGASMTITTNAIVDPLTGAQVPLQKNSIPINWENWNILPGGPKQEKPIIMPFWRFAKNAKDTTPNLPYAFRFDLGNIDDPLQNLDMPFDTDKKALILKGMGVRAAANLAKAWFELTGDPIDKVHPRGGISVTTSYNPINFGYGADALATAYLTIPRFAGRSLLVYNDHGYPVIQDNGTAVAAGSVTVALNGTIIELA